MLFQKRKKEKEKERVDAMVKVKPNIPVIININVCTINALEGWTCLIEYMATKAHQQMPVLAVLFKRE